MISHFTTFDDLYPRTEWKPLTPERALDGLRGLRDHVAPRATSVSAWRLSLKDDDGALCPIAWLAFNGYMKILDINDNIFTPAAGLRRSPYMTMLGWSMIHPRLGHIALMCTLNRAIRRMEIRFGLRESRRARAVRFIQETFTSFMGRRVPAR